MINKHKNDDLSLIISYFKTQHPYTEILSIEKIKNNFNIFSIKENKNDYFIINTQNKKYTYSIEDIIKKLKNTI